MANNTLVDSKVVVSITAHKVMRTYNDTMIAGFIASDTKEVLHLPHLYDSQRWYVNGDQVVGKKGARNPMNSTSLEPVF